MRELVLHFDGSCGPKNPGGTAAYGFHLAIDGQTASQGHGVIGTGPGMTNNLAEFHALWQGLTAVWKTVPVRGDVVTVVGDSNLVIQMMNDVWRAKRDKAYFPAYEAADASAADLRAVGVTVNFTWVPRERNTICDDLSKAHQQV